MSRYLTASTSGSKSRFIEMFEGAFPVKKWKDCLTITNGKAYKAEYLKEGLYPICGSGGIMGFVNEAFCSAKTIIIGRKGNINNPIYMDCDYWIVDTAFSLDVNRSILNPRFFYYWCKLFDFNRYNKQGVLPSLTKSDLLNIDMPIPSLDLQNEFERIYNQADKSGLVN